MKIKHLFLTLALASSIVTPYIVCTNEQEQTASEVTTTVTTPTTDVATRTAVENMLNLSIEKKKSSCRFFDDLKNGGRACATITGIMAPLLYITLDRIDYNNALSRLRSRFLNLGDSEMSAKAFAEWTKKVGAILHPASTGTQLLTYFTLIGSAVAGFSYFMYNKTAQELKEQQEILNELTKSQK